MSPEDERSESAGPSGPGGSGSGGGDSGPGWRPSLEAATREAAEEGKLVFLDLFDPG